MDAGLIENAEALCLAMTRAFPRHPAGMAGLAQVAMGRKNWPAALSWWDAVLKTLVDAPNPFWLTARALALFELGRREEAFAAIGHVIRDSPDHPAGHVALAQIAVSQRHWSEALARWDEALQRFGEHVSAANWKLARASALLEVGKADEAEANATDAVRKMPVLLGALLLLLRVHVAAGRLEAAWAALESSPFREIETVALLDQRFDILIRLRRPDEARALFARTLARASRPELLASLFAFVPPLCAGPERQRIRTALLHRSQALRRLAPPADSVPFGVLEARIHLALRDRNAMITAMDGLAEHPRLGEPGESLRRVAAVLSDRDYPDYSRDRFFGIGLSRTGTTTLAAALTLLGLNTLHWLNPLTCEVISDDDFPVFDAFTDTPVSNAFERIYERYPGSKFIFTTRLFDDWVQSMERLWRRQLGMSDFDRIRAELVSFPYGTEFHNINRSLYFSHGSYREAFAAHEKRVRQFFRDKPADRFLELDIFAGDGWGKLCAFVGRDAPAVPFPWENRSL